MTTASKLATRRPRRRPLRRAVRPAAHGALVGATALALTACAGAVKLNGQEVNADVPFLTVIEDQWRSDVAEAHASVSDAARCWLVRSEDTGNLDHQAYCGPVRHLTATATGVWDVYSFATTGTGDDVSIVDLAIKNRGGSLPTDREPFRPDGAEVPGDADKIAAPKPPPVERGFAAVVRPGQEVNLRDRKQPQSGQILAPDLELKVSEVGRTDMISGLGDAGVAGPADGEELLVATLQVRSTKSSYDWGSDRDVNTSPVFSVQTPSGRKRISLEPDTSGTGGASARSAAPTTLVASVPKGTDAQLVVGVAGVDQTMSLRTGERTSTTAAGYYRSRTSVDLNKQFPTSNAVTGDFKVRHSATFTKADILPFLPERGWAPAGNAWLTLHYDNASFEKLEHDLWYGDPNVAASKSITFTDERGKTHNYNGSLPTSDDYHDSGTMTVAIPDTAKRITVTYAPTGTFSATSFADPGDVNPSSGTFKFRPLTFSIPIPQV